MKTFDNMSYEEKLEIIEKALIDLGFVLSDRSIFYGMTGLRDAMSPNFYWTNDANNTEDCLRNQIILEVVKRHIYRGHGGIVTSMMRARESVLRYELEDRIKNNSIRLW